MTNPTSVAPQGGGRHGAAHFVDQDALFCSWAALDDCDACRDEAYARRNAPAPGRPFLAPREGAVLFIGEAPPEDGGFWKVGNGDGLRERLLPMLPAWPEDHDRHSINAIEWFVQAGYFFVQAMKWPLNESYNAQSAASRRALKHAVESHLEEEIESINPASIVALGGAAWDACTTLSEKHGLPLSDPLGVDKDRLRHHVFRMATGRDVSLHVTRLPGKQNDRFKWAAVIKHDIAAFLGCDPRANDCEKVERLAAPRSGRRSRSKADREREEKFARETKRRLKAAQLWPPPGGRSVEEIMAELELRGKREGSS